MSLLLIIGCLDDIFPCCTISIMMIAVTVFPTILSTNSCITKTDSICTACDCSWCLVKLRYVYFLATHAISSLHTFIGHQAQLFFLRWSNEFVMYPPLAITVLFLFVWSSLHVIVYCWKSVGLETFLSQTMSMTMIEVAPFLGTKSLLEACVYCMCYSRRITVTIHPRLNSFRLYSTFSICKICTSFIMKNMIWDKPNLQASWVYAWTAWARSI